MARDVVRPQGLLEPTRCRTARTRAPRRSPRPASPRRCGVERKPAVAERLARSANVLDVLAQRSAADLDLDVAEAGLAVACDLLREPVEALVLRSRPSHRAGCASEVEVTWPLRSHSAMSTAAIARWRARAQPRSRPSWYIRSHSRSVSNGSAPSTTGASSSSTHAATIAPPRVPAYVQPRPTCPSATTSTMQNSRWVTCRVENQSGRCSGICTAVSVTRSIIRAASADPRSHPRGRRGRQRRRRRPRPGGRTPA
jgi:hypothetical protein